MAAIINDNIKIHYEVIGDGEPLIMLHPNGHCLKDWYELGYVTRLQKYFQLILIDSRGFGDSDKPKNSDRYQPEIIASDTIAILDKLGIDKAHCFGYSMGGRQACALMNYYPDRFKSFVIGGAHPYVSNKLLNSYKQLLQQGIPKVVEVFENNFGVFPPEVKQNFLKNNADVLLAVNSVPLVDFSEARVNYQGNILFVVGEKDPILTFVKQAYQAKANAEIAVIPQKNHMQLFFDSEVMIPLLKDFCLVSD